ncbi:MAG TPA: tetratricopeptide repeat protein [Phycisphaerae bacterium]|nr:tetratricopeptide repeat protein [Phycisphaerae bacterium]
MLRLSIPVCALALGTLALGMTSGGCASTEATDQPDQTDQGSQEMMLASGRTQLRLAKIDRQRRAGRFEEALAAYREMLEELADDATMRARVWHELGVTFGQRADQGGGAGPGGDRAEALRCAQEASRAVEGATDTPPIELTAAIGLTLGRCQRLLGQTDEAIVAYENLLGRLPDDRVERVRALHELGNAYLERAGRRGGRVGSGGAFREDLEAARTRQGEALGLAKRVRKCPEHLIGWIHNSQGLICRQQSNLEEGVEQFKQAERVFSKADDSEQQMTAVQNLIQTLLEAGQYKEAGKQCKQLDGLPGVSRNPRALMTLGVAALSLGDMAEASTRFDLARFVAREQPRFADDPNLMAELAANAALCSQLSGDFDTAENLLTEAHERLMAGGGDPRTAAVIEANLGRMFLTLGRLDRAESQLQAARARQSDLLGEQHPDTLLTLLDLAALAQARARYGEAQTLCETALSGLEAALGSEHPSVATARMALAAVLNDRGQCAEAGEQADRAIAVFDGTLGRDHKRAIQAVLQATLYAIACQDSPEGAARFRTLRADANHRYEQLRRALGKDHVDVLQAMVLFADLNARTPEAHAKALEIYEAAESGFLESFGEQHISLAEIRYGQGRLLTGMGKLDRAFSVYTNALSRLGRGFERHPIRAKLLEGLGDVLEGRGEEAQARKYYQQAHQILTATYGSGHPLVQQFQARHGG